MSKKYNKIFYIISIAMIILIVLSLLIIVKSVYAMDNHTQKNSHKVGAAKIEAGIYVLVSFSMNNQSLHSYFLEANQFGAKLVMQGLAGQKDARNRFAETKARTQAAKINIDINPTIFEQLNVKHVPVIAVVNDKGKVRKISGHISLENALEIMEINPIREKK